MATRREVERRRRALQEALRGACAGGGLRPGDLLPPVTQLAEEHGLSVTVVRQALQPLMEEGLLYAVPRVGTFVGRPKPAVDELFLLPVADDPGQGGYGGQVHRGFEEAIARLGGASLAMPRERAMALSAAGDLPRLAGVFDFITLAASLPDWGAAGGTPLVRFGSPSLSAAGIDTVSFDDRGGGRLATRHLLELGHRRIAFLGLHGPDAAARWFGWSAERAKGWADEMEAAGRASDGLLLALQRDPDPADQVAAALPNARVLARRPDVTAVVTANDLAALALFDALREADLPTECWPAVVSFDDLLGARGYLVTSVRLPWEELGAAAAGMLWERRQGRMGAEPVHRQVPMRLVPRLTSRPSWPLVAGRALMDTLGEG